MSVSMWSYRPEVCDGGGCPGDCDLCDKPKNMEDEDEEELRAFVENILLDKREEMTRMIDKRGDDYIKRKDAVRIMAKYMMNTALIDKPGASDRIEEWESNVVAPIMSKLISNKDVVEVVRCKDCRRRDEKVNGIPLCPIALVKERAEDNDFCSWGERSDK